MIESEKTGYDWASGTEDPWGVVNVLIRQHCSLSVTETHVVLTCSPIWAPERNQAANQQEHLADFIHKLLFLLFFLE